MKKSLLAIAAMTAFAGAAQAQSSVTVYGIMDAGYVGVENATTAAGTKTTATGSNTGNSSGLSTSRLGFKGTEDLGGGTKAHFMLEYGLGEVGAGANSWGARESWIGLDNAKMGQLRLGRQQSSIHAVVANGLAGSANNIAGSIYSNTTSSSVITAGVRPHGVYLNNAVTYISPTMSGLTLQAQTSNAATSASDNAPSVGTRESGASLTFTGVKNLKVAYGIQQSNAYAASSNSKITSQALSANYNFGVAQVFAIGAQKKQDDLATGQNTLKTTSYELGVKAPLTPKIGVWASALMGDRNGPASGTTYATGNADVSGFQLGSTYAFSKRTTGYAIYGQQNIKGTDNASGSKIESTGYGVGVRHSF